MKKLIQSLFNRKRVYSSSTNTIVRPMDFKYNPINSNPKKLGLEHSPNIKSVTEPPITSTQWCIEEHKRFANTMVGKKWKGI